MIIEDLDSEKRLFLELMKIWILLFCLVSLSNWIRFFLFFRLLNNNLICFRFFVVFRFVSRLECLCMIRVLGLFRLLFLF